MDFDVHFTAIDGDELDRMLAAGIDHGGNAIEPFVDPDGGWTMRCCLTDSHAGERLALVAWSPFRWNGPYREVGPIVVHADGCDHPASADHLPTALDERAMDLRPYTHDRRIAYHHVRRVPEGSSVSEHVRNILEHDDVAFVHGRNITGG